MLNLIVSRPHVTTNDTILPDLEVSYRTRTGVPWDGTFGGLNWAIAQLGVHLGDRISVECGIAGFSHTGNGRLYREDDPDGTITIMEGK